MVVADTHYSIEHIHPDDWCELTKGNMHALKMQRTTFTQIVDRSDTQVHHETHEATEHVHPDD